MNQPRTVTRHARRPATSRKVELLDRSTGKRELTLSLDEAATRLSRVTNSSEADCKAALLEGQAIRTVGYVYQVVK